MVLALCLQLKWRGKVHSVVEVEGKVEFIHRNASSKNKFPVKKREGGEEVSNNCFIYHFKTNSDIYAAYKHKYLRIYYVSHVKISHEFARLAIFAMIMAFSGVLSFTWINRLLSQWRQLEE